MHDAMMVEHEAWTAVVAELHEALGPSADIEQGGDHERLHDAIVRWGEELAQLRLSDPSHAPRALAERRAQYARWTSA